MQKRINKVEERFIPTLVGNTGVAKRSPTDFAVHPHACGEHARQTGGRCNNRGSSPRLWGTRAITFFNMVDGRFIPTLVGNTGDTLFITSSRSVHPHACGEHKSNHLNRLAIDGSSPRLWGTHSTKKPRFKAGRFIPTLVGNTRIIENHAKLMAGSSPRLWGTHIACYIVALAIRFIPTLVGNTKVLNRSPFNKAVHPHACGEHVFILFLRL